MVQMHSMKVCTVRLIHPKIHYILWGGCLGACNTALQWSQQFLLENRAGKVNSAVAQVKVNVALLYFCSQFWGTLQLNTDRINVHQLYIHRVSQWLHWSSPVFSFRGFYNEAIEIIKTCDIEILLVQADVQLTFHMVVQHHCAVMPRI